MCDIGRSSVSALSILHSYSLVLTNMMRQRGYLGIKILRSEKEWTSLDGLLDLVRPNLVHGKATFS